MLRAYSSDGVVLQSASGTGWTGLDFFAPKDGIYYYSFAMSDGTKQYSLELIVEEAKRSSK